MLEEVRRVMRRLIAEYRLELVVFGEWDRGEWPYASCYDRRG
jgi:hypothetical protein